jgi:hypothetical protein
MGHEHVEIKNSHTAIEAYRRAVDVNRKDYPLYGMGSAKHMSLNMHQFALILINMRSLHNLYLCYPWMTYRLW